MRRWRFSAIVAVLIVGVFLVLSAMPIFRGEVVAAGATETHSLVYRLQDQSPPADLHQTLRQSLLDIAPTLEDQSLRSDWDTLLLEIQFEEHSEHLLITYQVPSYHVRHFDLRSWTLNVGSGPPDATAACARANGKLHEMVEEQLDRVMTRMFHNVSRLRPDSAFEEDVVDP